MSTVNSQHSKLLDKAAQARAEGDRQRARELTEQANKIQEDITEARKSGSNRVRYQDPKSGRVAHVEVGSERHAELVAEGAEKVTEQEVKQIRRQATQPREPEPSIPKQSGLVRQNGETLYAYEVQEGGQSVTLYVPNDPTIRETISREEWNRRFPDNKLETDPTILSPPEPMIGSAYGSKRDEDLTILTPSLSRELFEKSKQYSRSDVETFMGVRYSPQGAYQIGSVIVGGFEAAVTPFARYVPGKQPLEVGPGEVGVDWRNIDDLSEGELSEREIKIAELTGFTTEAAATLGVGYGVGYVAGTSLGLAGSTISKIPRIGPYFTSAGAKIVNVLNTPLGKAALTAPIVIIQGVKTYGLIQSGRSRAEVVGETVIDASRLVGTGIGLSRGISFGRQLPVKVEQKIRGGEVFQESEIVPEYVTSGEKRFPGFRKEPFEPTPQGYRAMSQKYTPSQLRITEEGISSYHTTDAPIKGDFVSQIGKRTGTLRYSEELGKFVGKGEYGMFYAPASSTNFLRLGKQGYSLSPGVQNIFGESKIIYTEFPQVQATGLSKSSPQLASILSESGGSGVVFMPSEQLSEAQVILGPGTQMVSVKDGRFFADIGGKTVRIERYLPSAFADSLPIGTKLSAEQLAAQQSLYTSYLFNRPGTTYIPVNILGTSPVESPLESSSTPSAPLQASIISEPEQPSSEPVKTSSPSSKIRILSQTYTRPKETSSTPLKPSKTLPIKSSQPSKIDILGSSSTPEGPSYTPRGSSSTPPPIFGGSSYPKPPEPPPTPPKDDDYPGLPVLGPRSEKRMKTRFNILGKTPRRYRINTPEELLGGPLKNRRRLKIL